MTFVETFVETFIETFIETFVETFIETFIETFVETIVRLPSILILHIGRALELHKGFELGFEQSLKGGPPWTPLRTAA